MQFPLSRPRRLRQSAALRALLRENRLCVDDLVYPVFVSDQKDGKEAIAKLPGQFRYSLPELLKECEELTRLGIKALALFPAIEDKLKDATAREAFNPKGLIPRVIQSLKSAFPDLLLISDVALDPYSSEGHDGLVKDGKVLNDETLEVLCAQALCQARAGANIVAPSDMMDGRVQAIRNTLDGEGFHDVLILSYAAKYASQFYGPFRAALNSQPRHGDKKTYQMDPANLREAVKEAEMDIAEGADIIMVKPALAYLDVIHELRSFSPVPIAAYSVSGEYAMLKFAAQAGVLDEAAAQQELLLSMKRAGADLIFSYAAKEVAKILLD